MAANTSATILSSSRLVPTSSSVPTRRLSYDRAQEVESRTTNGSCTLRTAQKPRFCRTAATAYPGIKQIDYLGVFDEEGEDYYEILGVDPECDKKDIKKAYYTAIRDCHPDSNQGDELAVEFAMFLNEIYETLMDDEQRADYNALIGFSSKAINPFMDASYERDQIFVDEISCIGCTNCAGVCPRTFEMQWEEHGRARAVAQGIDTPDDVQDAIDSCPVNCIHKVSSPQLTLLETVMRKMERVDVCILMSGGGHGYNPFTEASIAWQKRQAQRQARQLEEQRRAIWAMWEPAGGSDKAAGKQQQQAASASSLKQQRSAETAEKAARAARRWRDYQRRKSSGQALQLPGN